MKIDVTNRGEDGIISFKAETAAEVFQLEFLLLKAEANHLDAFTFTGWDDDEGISFVTKLKTPQCSA